MTTNLVALPAGTELVGEYRIERVLGAGGFGITYLAVEKSLARKVTIKEYFPVDFAARNNSENVVPRSRDSEADYKWGLQRFLDEAKTLAKFSHPNIVGVHRYFEARKTGFIVLHYESGGSFRGWLMRLKRAPRQNELDGIVGKLLDALETIHAADFLHRDIAPDNIMMRPDGSPVLIDFGSARKEVAKRSKQVSALVKPGYSPYEQYATSGKQQGPWTDIYSLAATLYHAMTGKRPPDAPSRMVHDDLVPIKGIALSSYRADFLAAIDRALVLDVSGRPQSVAEWRGMLFAEQKPRRLSNWRGGAGADGDAPVARSKPPEDAPRPDPKAKAAGQSDAVPPGARVASGGGLISAFREGWRQAGPDTGAPVAEAVEASAVQGKAGVMRRPSAVEAAKPTLPPPPSRQAPDTRSAAPLPGPGSGRPDAPGNTRRWRAWHWAALGTKVAAGIAFVCATVILQHQLAPTGPSLTAANTQPVPSKPPRPDANPMLWLPAHDGDILGLSTLPDGRTLVSLAADATARVWSTASRTVQRSWHIAGARPTSLAVEAGKAAIGHADGTISIWAVDTGDRLSTLQRPGRPVTAITFTGDGGSIAALQGNVAALWDLGHAPSEPNVVFGNEEAAAAIAYARNGMRLATGAENGVLNIWRKTSPRIEQTATVARGAISALAFSPKGGLLAFGSASGQLSVVLAASGAPLAALQSRGPALTALAYSPDGRILAAANRAGVVQLWDHRQRRELRRFSLLRGPANAVVWTADGNTIVAASGDGRIQSWIVAPASAGPGRSGQ